MVFNPQKSIYPFQEKKYLGNKRNLNRNQQEHLISHK